MQKDSKVAICKKCKCFVKACATDSLTRVTEKEFTELTNEGFEVKLETKNATRKRGYSAYEDCKAGKCKKFELEAAEPVQGKINDISWD